MRRAFLSVTLLAHLAAPVHIDLGGIWSLRNFNASIEVNATVPGTVHAALLQVGRISDPLYRFAAEQSKWVSLESWTYSRVFDLAKDQTSADRVELTCHGLATAATVRINGVTVLKADNMFRTWRVDIKKAAKQGPNLIEVDFESTVAFATRQAAAYTALGVLPQCAGDASRLGCHRNFVRHQQSEFGDAGCQLETREALRYNRRQPVDAEWGSQSDLFLASFRRMPTANAEGQIESEGGIGRASARRVFRVPSDRRGSSAFAVGMRRNFEKKTILRKTRSTQTTTTRATCSTSNPTRTAGTCRTLSCNRRLGGPSPREGV